jgi:hypothetical protein
MQFKEIEKLTASTAVFEIYMAGDISDAKRFLVKRAAESGACWSVDPTEFVYSGGRELGFIVRIINYPRFPKPVDTLREDAIVLARALMIELGQGSCSIVGPDTTVWLNRRPL